MNFVENVLELINKFGITKNKMLTDLNLSKNSFVDWTTRGTIPNGDTLAKIAEYFNVSTDYLLGKTDIKNKPTANKDSELIKAEADLLELFRNVPEENQSLVLEMIEAALKNQGLLK